MSESPCNCEVCAHAFIWIIGFWWPQQQVMSQTNDQIRTKSQSWKDSVDFFPECLAPLRLFCWQESWHKACTMWALLIEDWASMMNTVRSLWLATHHPYADCLHHSGMLLCSCSHLVLTSVSNDWITVGQLRHIAVHTIHFMVTTCVQILWKKKCLTFTTSAFCCIHFQVEKSSKSCFIYLLWTVPNS